VDPESPGSLGDVPVTLHEHALEVLPLNPIERHRSRRDRPVVGLLSALKGLDRASNGSSQLLRRHRLEQEAVSPESHGSDRGCDRTVRGTDKAGCVRSSGALFAFLVPGIGPVWKVSSFPVSADTKADPGGPWGR